MRLTRVFLFAAVLFATGFLVVMINAQTENDPQGSSISANECYTGGVLEGKCNADGVRSDEYVEWAWTCGWYLWRFNHDGLSREAFPATCFTLLPNLMPVVVDEPTPLPMLLPTLTAYPV